MSDGGSLVTFNSSLIDGPKSEPELSVTAHGFNSSSLIAHEES